LLHFYINYYLTLLQKKAYIISRSTSVCLLS